MYSGEEFTLKVGDDSQFRVLFQVLCKCGTLLLIASNLFSIQQEDFSIWIAIINIRVFRSMKCILSKAAAS